jgi:glycosyltransferase involved in cell wall biosynthesis
MKIRVLWVGEASFLNTGYSVYAREVLSRLHQHPNLEVAELACYAHQNDPRCNGIPWKIYPVVPNESDPIFNEYQNSIVYQWGGGIFDDVVLDFKPHVVIDIRDVFMFDYQDTSPLREYFYWLTMPTVDSAPQNRQWLDIMSRTDAIFTYQDWSADLIRKESLGRINWVGSAPSSADAAFTPMDKEECKKLFGLEGNKIVGTVMRNQRRKLFPELFRTFRQYLDQSRRTDVLLYCHTSYPDNAGWDFPTLLSEQGLYSRVLFTHICLNCNSVFPDYFRGQQSVCPSCNHYAVYQPNVKKGLDNTALATVYNLFDVYVQYVTNEGLGMPQLEAAACGVPVIGTDYSAMEDVIRKINGKPIRVLTKNLEIETGTYKAIPDNQHLLEVLTESLSLSPNEWNSWSRKTLDGYHRNYSWDKTANKWLNAILKVPIDRYDALWMTPPKIHIPPQPNYEMSNSDFAKWLIVHVLGEPHRLNSLMHLRLEKDLNTNLTDNVMGGLYFNEMSELFARSQKEVFTKQIAYEKFVQLRNRKNHWEQLRVQSIRNK